MRGWIAALGGLALLIAWPASAQEAVTIGLVGEPTSLDPTLSADPATLEIAYQNIFEGLTRLGADGKAEPDLAQSWELSQDGKSYTFHIRPGVRFHDGTTLSAKQVVFSLNRLLAPASRNPARADYTDIAKVTAPDLQTVVLSLDKPDPGLPALLARPAAVIVAPESVDNNAEEPLGTGPYAFVEWDKGQGVLVERNEDFWGDHPDLYHAQFSFEPDAKTAFDMLAEGQVEAVVGLKAADVPAGLRSDARFKVVTSPDGHAAVWPATLTGFAADPGFPACILRVIKAAH